MTTTIHSLTNGVENYLFEITGDIATLTTVNAAIGRNGGLLAKEEITTAEARKMWAYGLKHGCVEGWTEPSVADPEAPLCVD